jgi:alanine racemase
VPPSEAPDVARRIAGSRDLVLEGVWTHFADAASSGGRKQLERFLAVREALGRHGVRALVHAANSAAALALPASRFDMVRVGTLLYGQQPPGVTASLELHDPFSWHAVVVSVRDLPAGATVGYGSEWRAKRPIRVATIPVGWADGFTVEPHARTDSAAEAARTTARAVASATHVRATGRFVWIAGRRASVVGRVGMQAVTVAVPDGLDVAAGDTVRLPARRILVNAAIDRVYVP